MDDRDRKCSSWQALFLFLFFLPVLSPLSCFSKKIIRHVCQSIPCLHQAFSAGCEPSTGSAEAYHWGSTPLSRMTSTKAYPVPFGVTLIFLTVCERRRAICWCAKLMVLPIGSILSSSTVHRKSMAAMPLFESWTGNAGAID